MHRLSWIYTETDQCAVYYCAGVTAIICDDDQRERASADRGTYPRK
jgi:hypothetical protein